MPTAETVLSWATGVANEWRWLAIVWHIALGGLLVAIGRVRVSQRLLGLLLVFPIISVAMLAWASGNPFNGLTFTVLAVLLLRSGGGLPQAPVTRASWGRALPGMALIVLGWLYPHFLSTTTWTAYVYASPFGLLPCPTLSVVIGVTAAAGLRSVGWNGALAAAGILYGVIGVFGLRVWLDLWLLAGAVLPSTIVLADVIGRTRADLRRAA